MNILMITGDKNFGPGQPRFELQKNAVEALAVIYFGRGSMFPRIPAGHWDTVTVQDPFWRGLFAWHVARRTGAKFNIQVHTDISAQPWTRRMLARILLRRADSIRVVSDKIKSQVITYGVHAPVTMLPVFVDVERFKDIVRQPHDKKTILWLGRFEGEKDPLLALEIVRKVRESTDARLIMLGGGSLEPALKEIATHVPAEFPGWQDPAAYVARADVVLSTSRHESYGASIIEALAAGVPVVAPDVGVAKEAGALVVPREELAAKVEEVLRSGARGTLQLVLPDREEWAKRWRHSLL